MYSLGTLFVSGIYIYIYTLHKGDNEMMMIMIIIIIIIIQTEVDSKCRLCKHFYKRLEHIISACPIIAKEHYTKRNMVESVLIYTLKYARK
jgi:hypothetical protein